MNIDLTDYIPIRFRITRTNHLLVSATINGAKGKFILDTGASNSCVDFTNVEYFNLTAEHSKTKAAGAGAIGMLTQAAIRNKICISRWKFSDFNLVVLDLSHINAALVQHKARPVQGILGADILMEGNAVIDYATKFLYLKKK